MRKRQISNVFLHAVVAFEMQISGANTKDKRGGGWQERATFASFAANKKKPNWLLTFKKFAVWKSVNYARLEPFLDRAILFFLLQMFRGFKSRKFVLSFRPLARSIPWFWHWRYFPPFPPNNHANTLVSVRYTVLILPTHGLEKGSIIAIPTRNWFKSEADSEWITWSEDCSLWHNTLRISPLRFPYDAVCEKHRAKKSWLWNGLLTLQLPFMVLS